MDLQLSAQVQRCVKCAHFWVALWLLFLASTIWWHAKTTNQPPVDDAMTYYEKARNFWGSIRSGGWHNPLDIEPTIRPPGTILMAYPFGFRKDFHGFYFRSVYVPILSLVLSVYLAGYSSKPSRLRQWDLALLAIFLSTLPAFYHFEIASFDHSGTYWGLVDLYLAGVASLAAASCIRAVKTCSWKWLVLTVLVAALCLLIKPSGVFVMICVAVGYTVALTTRLCLTKEVQQKRQIRNLLISALLFIAAVDSLTVFGCLHSKYLSQENLLFGKATVSIMRAELSAAWSDILKSLLSQFGWVLPTSMVLVGLALVFCWRRVNPAVIGYGPGSFASLLLFSFLCFGAGVWFWIVWSGGITQMRYFSPFAFMAIIATVPFFIVGLQQLPPAVRIVFWGLWLASAGNMALLLAQREPPVNWQSATGVNLSAEGFETELTDADIFFQHLLEQHKNAYIYSLYSDTYVFMIESGLYFKCSLHNDGPQLFIRRPIDWSRDSAVRVGELLDSDYILFAPRSDAVRVATLSKQTVANVWEETWVFDSWLTNLNASDGVETIFKTPRAQLVKITDASKLEASLSKLLQGRQWPRSFLDANPQRWWRQDELTEETKKAPSLVHNINFGGVFKVQALSLEKADQVIRIRIWVEPLHHTPGVRWFVFFHQMDAQKAITKYDEFLLPEQLPDDPQESVMETISLTTTNSQAVHAIGIGIRDDSRVPHYLPADKGARDSNNMRVVIPVELLTNGIAQPQS